MSEQTTRKTGIVEGVYEFVSETTTLTKPENVSSERTSNDWLGMWFFKGNRYGYEMMFKRRPPFPKTPQDLGYRSGAGEFELKGNSIMVQPIISLSQADLLQSKTLEFAQDGSTLTLIEIMTPQMENLAEGRRITILRKVD